MNLNELLLGSVMTGRDTSVFPQTVRQTGAGGQRIVSFGQLLDSKMYEASATGTGSAGSYASVQAARQEPPTGVKNEQEPLYRSYRQLRGISGRQQQPYRADMNKTVSEASEDSGDEKFSSGKQMEASAEILELLAHMLGVDKSRLEALLEENGIHTDELTGIEGIKKATEVLSEMFGLEEGQTEALSELLRIIRDLVLQQTASRQIIPDHGNTVPDGNESAEAESFGTGTTDLPQRSDQTSELVEQLSAYIRQKLDEYAERLKNGREDLKNEISEAMRELFVRTESVKQDIVNAAQVTEDDDEAEDTADTGSQEDDLTVRKDEQAEADENDLKTTDGSNRQANMQQTQQISDEVQQPGVFQVMNGNMNDPLNADIPVKASEQTLPAREIIGQIVEKASVILGQDKSEMVMELKPENLGRISLRVATENGIVVARFVAENRQVQQVLESNMQLLRDSLERQGINVQSLSVSVRQDSGQNGEDRQQFRNTTGIRNRRASAGIAARGSIFSAIAEESTERNPYLWDNSTINITA